MRYVLAILAFVLSGTVLLGQILLPILAGSHVAHVNIGLDFRATSGFVTDPANTTYVIGDSYPTTRGGFTFGWETSIDGTRDRSTMVDPVLAGINFQADGGSTATFRVDLPSAGTYILNFAGGDESTAQGDQDITVKDNTTNLLFIAGNLVDANSLIDANSQKWTPAAWPGSNVPKTLTFSSTIARFVIAGGGSGATCITHINLSK